MWIYKLNHFPQRPLEEHLKKLLRKFKFKNNRTYVSTSEVFNELHFAKQQYKNYTKKTLWRNY